MLRHTPKNRLWRMEVVVALSMAALLILLLGGALYIATLLNKGLEEDERNQRLARYSLRQASYVLEEQLPLESQISRLANNAIHFRDEFELVVLDPDRDDTHLHDLYQLLKSDLYQLKPLMAELPADLTRELQDNAAILIDIAEEVLDTPNANARGRLFRDTLTPLGQVNLSIDHIRAQLKQKSDALKLALLSTGAQAQESMARHHELFSRIKTSLSIALGLIIIIALAAQVFFFRILYYRIHLLEGYANEIAEGRFLAPPFSSKDRTGMLAIRLALMGRRIRKLLGQSRIEAQLAEQAKADAEQLAFYDPLTSLENRRLFFKRLEHALHVVERHPDEPLALLYLDLDNFKQINDTLGHNAGDELLTAVANRLRLNLRQEDSLARLGGDEFAMLVHQPSKACATLAQRILDRLREPITIGNRELLASTSIGIAVAGPDGTNPVDLLRHADLALYRAKELGRNNYQFFSADLNAKAVSRMHMIDEIREAISTQAFCLHYQPKYSLQHGVITGLEALIRWPHPKEGHIFPNQFIPLAEETGLIMQIGEWVLRTACQQAKELLDRGNPLPIAINISARQFHDAELVNLVRRVLADTGLPPHLLELEITETMLIDNIEQSIEVMDTLKREGVNVAIDDFGTGFSSMNYLKQLPLDVLKVDRSFVSHAAENPKDGAIAITIIQLAHRLGLKVVAEGIESPQQLAFLRQQGCDMGQGYLLSRPQPMEALDFSGNTPACFNVADVQA